MGKLGFWKFVGRDRDCPRSRLGGLRKLRRTPWARNHWLYTAGLWWDKIAVNATAFWKISSSASDSNAGCCVLYWSVFFFGSSTPVSIWILVQTPLGQCKFSFLFISIRFLCVHEKCACIKHAQSTTIWWHRQHRSMHKIFCEGRLLHPFSTKEKQKPTGHTRRYARFHLFFVAAWIYPCDSRQKVSGWVKQSCHQGIYLVFFNLCRLSFSMWS